MHVASRAAIRTLAAFVGLWFALALADAPAQAHAELVGSNPAAGAQIERGPADVMLTFDEDVETAMGSVRVFDAAGTSHTAGPVVHPNGDARRVSVRVGALERGRYVVAWRGVSADSHRVGGAFAFGIGTPAGTIPGAPRDNGAETLLPILHFLLLAAAVLGIGLPVGVATIARRSHRAPLPLEFGAWFVVAFAAFATSHFAPTSPAVRSRPHLRRTPVRCER